MKLPVIGAGLAAAAVLGLVVGFSAPKAEAASTCVVTIVKNFKDACPAGTKFAGGGTGSVSVLPEPAVTPTVTPTSGPAACVKTNVHNLKDSCNRAG
jgi:hypothetical protein